VDAGETQSGVLLARTALGAVEAGSSEYGIEVRDLCCGALRKGAPTTAGDAYHRAALHVRKVASYVCDTRLRALFMERPVVRRILEADAQGPSAGLDPLHRGEMA
jgi:hypothetical protein